jgi:tyrosinase
MLHITLFGILALVLGASAGSYPPDVVDNLAAESIIKLKDYIDKNPIGGTGNCTLQNAAKRYEWLVPAALLIYID